MRPAFEDPELRELVHRDVAPERRYMRLLGGDLMRMAAPELHQFTTALGHAADQITPHELRILLEGGWRERHTAAWRIAVARRTEFREHLGKLLLASEVCHAGRGYCLAPATFGTPPTADLLASYLDRYLRRPDLYYDQADAIGALLHLDTKLHTNRAAPFLAPGGLWQQWIDGPPTKQFEAQTHHRITDRLCSIAAESRSNALHQHKR